MPCVGCLLIGLRRLGLERRVPTLVLLGLLLLPAHEVVVGVEPGVAGQLELALRRQRHAPRLVLSFHLVLLSVGYVRLVVCQCLHSGQRYVVPTIPFLPTFSYIAFCAALRLRCFTLPVTEHFLICPTPRRAPSR